MSHIDRKFAEDVQPGDQILVLGATKTVERVSQHPQDDDILVFAFKDGGLLARRHGASVQYLVPGT